MSLQLFAPRVLLTPWIRLALTSLVALIAVVVIARLWDDMWAWAPWSPEQRLERAEARADRAGADAAARSLESAANADQARRVEAAQRQIIELRTQTIPILVESRSAPDANHPIDPVRADRLRAHDRLLCDAAPELGGCAAPDQLAGHGD